MHKGIFITGTDTGVGKTFVAVGLITALRKLGYRVCPMKPAETGCVIRKGRLVPGDSLKLIKSAHVDETLDMINPYRFRHPLAPAVAAELAGTSIRKKKIFFAYRKLSKKNDIVIVEGAGGIMVPLYKKYLLLDLIKDLTLHILIVSRPGLGTINHTLLTIDAARNREIDISGVVINYSTNMGRDVSERTNPWVIEKLTGVPVLGIVPYMKGPRMKTFKHLAGKMLSRL
jgi:dethiobiotin synthetase